MMIADFHVVPIYISSTIHPALSVEPMTQPKWVIRSNFLNL